MSTVTSNFFKNFGTTVVAFLTLRHRMSAVVLVEDARPSADALQDRDNRSPLIRQAVFHSGWNLIIGFSLDQAIRDQFLQR